MAVLLGFAFLSGLVTVLSPCILPVLPLVLSGSVGGGRARPLGVLAGFVASFAAFTLSLTALVRALGISPDALRIAAIVIIAAFGLVMLVPALAGLFERVTSRISGLAAGSRPAPGTGSAMPRKTGFLSGIPVGLGLGLVWTPCVGPIMASVVSLALTERVDGGAVAITLAYTLGTSLPMLAVMLGGRALLARVPALTRNAARIQKGFGVVMILLAVAIGLGWDRQFQAAVLRTFPGYGAGLTAIEEAAPVREALERRTSAGAATGAAAGAATDAAAGDKVFTGAPGAAPRGKAFTGGLLPDLGAAPGLVAAGPWFNSGESGTEPLAMESLRGRVVIVDFWTYSCINCVRTIPSLRAWYDAYRDKGLVIVGVHTPEFEFEKKSANVQRAIRDLGVTWPVVQDNDFAQWTAYANRYWPAHYFIDARGRVRAFHFGEGGSEEGERIIQALLKEAGWDDASPIVSRPGPRTAARTPETYLGYMRSRGFVSTPAALPDAAARYEPSRSPGNGEWSLRGDWTITREFAAPEPGGVLELGFDAMNVFLVIEPGEPGAALEVRVDGKLPADTADVKAGRLVTDGSRMYHLVGLGKPGRHLLRLEARGAARLFAFTFG